MGSPLPPSGDTHDLAVALAPVLRSMCEHRLSEITWFRSRWQRGGAATGFATWQRTDNTTAEVFVKLPVSYTEYFWTSRLGEVNEKDWHLPSCAAMPVPRVVAHGMELGGYDLGWIITEKLSGPPLVAQLDKPSILSLLSAAADFQAEAMKHAPLDVCPVPPDWDRLIDKSRHLVREGTIPEPLRWKAVLRRVHKALPMLKSKWRSRPINAWCHGDLHAGNALRRFAPNIKETEESRLLAPCVLVDLALVHPGHWLEDAIYFERQHWGHSDLLKGIKPLSHLASLRRDRGLPVDDSYPLLANIRRVLMASCAPAVIDREGDQAYLHAALEVAERFIPQVLGDAAHEIEQQV